MSGQVSPFRIGIYDRNFQWKAPLESIIKLDATIRHNAISDLTLTVPASHRRKSLLGTPGTRLLVEFRDRTLISGPVRPKRGSGPGKANERSFGIQSDFRMLHNTRGWANPLGSPAQQGEDGTHYTIGRAPAETVIKDVVRRNIVERLGKPLTIAPDQGRGGLMEATFRNHRLADRLFPAADLAGVGVSVVMVPGQGWLLDCYEVTPYPNVLTEESRVIQSWDWSGEAPEVTRGLIGGQGEGTARTFTPFLDAAREEEWGDWMEDFVDARDTGDGLTYAARGQQALDEGAPTGSLTVKLAETGRFRIGGAKGLNVGQLVTASVDSDTIRVTDVLREQKIGWSKDGLTLESTIGFKDDPTTAVHDAILALARAIGTEKVSR